MDGHNFFTIAYYNICLPHSSLLQYEGSTPVPTTPAMAAKITDHPWSIQELLAGKDNYD